MTVQDIEASRAANAAAITKTNEAEAALVGELYDLECRASVLRYALESARLCVMGHNTDSMHNVKLWERRKEINPTLEHFGFVIAEHPTLRDVGVVVRKK